MSLKDRLSEALAATPPQNTRRLDTLKAALNAGDSDVDMADALSRLIEARETRATALEHEGQKELAVQERAEIAELKTLLVGEAAPAAVAKTGAKKGGVITGRQMIIGGVALAVVAAAIFVLLRPSDDSALTAQPAAQNIVYKDDHTLGNPKAPITVVEYAAPVCPHCAHFAVEDFPVLKRDFIDTGRIFYIFRVFPIRAQDGAIEGIARCLPKERYFPYMEMMFREQPQWDPDGYDIPDVEGAIIKLAAREGISPEKAKQCIADPANQDRINQVSQDAQLKYQIEGTPTFVMNGQVVNIPPGQKILDVLRLRINSLSSGASQ
jgi:protein-disulfide isomerase